MHKGYVLYASHQPPLCLRLDQRLVRQNVAKSLCRQEQADLVRVKTIAVYDIVKDLLTSESQRALVSRFYLTFCPWGLESKVTFTQYIPYKQIHEYY